MREKKLTIRLSNNRKAQLTFKEPEDTPGIFYCKVTEEVLDGLQKVLDSEHIEHKPQVEEKRIIQ